MSMSSCRPRVVLLIATVSCASVCVAFGAGASGIGVAGTLVFIATVDEQDAG